MDDESYESIFVPIISKVMETFQPSAVVLQCGADSLTGDRLGCFNLTVRGGSQDVMYSSLIQQVAIRVKYINPEVLSWCDSIFLYSETHLNHAMNFFYPLSM
jgi:hypothetical protein